jgi:hypothetical protein
VTSTGHAFVQNFHRDHYELVVEDVANLRVLAAFDELALAIDQPGSTISPARLRATHHPRNLRIDRAAAKREAHLDGKWLLRTSDMTLTAEDLTAADEQLIAAERGWKDCKGSLGLRPVYHHRQDRIRAHVQLCWLALLLIRVAETTTGDIWRNLRHELDRMHLVTLATAHGRVAQRSATPVPRRASWTRSSCPNHPNTSTSAPPPAQPIPAVTAIV